MERGQLVLIPSRIRVGVRVGVTGFEVGEVVLPSLSPTSYETISILVAPCPHHFPGSVVVVERKVGKVLPVVVGVSDSWTTRDCCRLIASAFYQWRARVTVFHVYVRTPRDYAPRRTRDIVRRRGADARFLGRRTWNPVTRRVSRRRTVSRDHEPRYKAAFSKCTAAREPFPGRTWILNNPPGTLMSSFFGESAS